MKTLLTMFALLCAATASAETITLLPTQGFGYLHQYHDVATCSIDASGECVGPVADVQIYAGSTLILDGVFYSCAGNICTNADGDYVTLTYTEVSQRKQINRGRLHQWVTVWFLVEGSIER